ncbi:unnamed protein product [Moneuplotes crassus]|uniref:Uncharacterized protein n=1 Tax=Euplotes crassus TaxID=5936 RepID=A0AAD1XYV4_EUPCR|nr:unnamed protein product [Moneuplotes crassus]
MGQEYLYTVDLVVDFDASWLSEYTRMYLIIEDPCEVTEERTCSPVYFTQSAANKTFSRNLMTTDGSSTFSTTVTFTKLGNATMRTELYLKKGVSIEYSSGSHIKAEPDFTGHLEQINLITHEEVYPGCTRPCPAKVTATLTPMHSGLTPIKLFYDNGVDMWINGEAKIALYGAHIKGNYESEYEFNAFSHYSIEINWIDLDTLGQLHFYWDLGAGMELIHPKYFGDFQDYGPVVQVLVACLEKYEQVPGTTDQCRPICGDGFKAGEEISEQNCDDWNVIDGDGCSSLCKIESGWRCQGSDKLDPDEFNPDTCEDICGDGKVVAPKDGYCDDHNDIDEDGCSSECGVESGWTCTLGNADTASSCKDICGDGIVMNEPFTNYCDDGNNNEHDGCSPTCEVEDNWNCTNGSTSSASRCSYSIPNYLKENSTIIEQGKNKTIPCQSFCGDLGLVKVSFTIECNETQEGSPSSIATINSTTGEITVNSTNLLPDPKNYTCKITATPNYANGQPSVTTYNITEFIKETSGTEAQKLAATLTTVLIASAIVLAFFTSLSDQSSPSGVFSLINQQQLLLLLLLLKTSIHPNVRSYIATTNFLMLDFQFIGNIFTNFFLIQGFIDSTNSEDPDSPIRWLGHDSTSTLYINRNLLLLFWLVFCLQAFFWFVFLVILFIQMANTMRHIIAAMSNIEIQDQDQRADESASNEARPDCFCIKYFKLALSFIQKLCRPDQGFHWKFFISIYTRMILEAFLDLFVTSLNEIQVSDTSAPNYEFSRVFAYFVLTMLGLFFVFTCGYCWYHFRDEPQYEKLYNQSEEDSDPNSQRLFGELYSGFRAHKLARVHQPLLLLRKLVFAGSIMAIEISSIQVYRVMLVFQIFYWAATVLFPMLTKFTFDFAIQQVNEVFLIVILIFFMKQKTAKDWGITTDSHATKNIAVTLITTNTFIVIILLLTKSLREAYSKAKQCTKKEAPQLDRTAQISEGQSSEEQEVEQEERNQISGEHKQQEEHKNQQEDKLERPVHNMDTHEDLLNFESADKEALNSSKRFIEINKVESLQCLSDKTRPLNTDAALSSEKSNTKYHKDNKCVKTNEPWTSIKEETKEDHSIKHEKSNEYSLISPMNETQRSMKKKYQQTSEDPIELDPAKLCSSLMSKPGPSGRNRSDNCLVAKPNTRIIETLVTHPKLEKAHQAYFGGKSPVKIKKYKPKSKIQGCKASEV